MKNRTGKDLPLLEEFRTFLKDQADLIDSVEKQRPERYPAKVTYHLSNVESADIKDYAMRYM